MGGVGLRAGWGWAGWVAGGQGGRGVVQTFIQPKMLFVWLSKEHAQKVGRIGNLEKSCSDLEKSCHHLEKRGKMLEKRNSMVKKTWLDLLETATKYCARKSKYLEF